MKLLFSFLSRFTPVKPVKVFQTYPSTHFWGTLDHSAFPGKKPRCRADYAAFILAAVGMGILGFKGQAASPVELVSVADASLQPPAASGGDSYSPALSADGRFVAFVSSAVNLISNGPSGTHLDVYVRDRQTGKITLVSASADGRSGGNDDSLSPAVSADGRWVVFESAADNLVTNLTQGMGDLYIRDLVGGVTSLVSVNADSQGGNGISTGASLTPDGRFVVFESDAGDLAPNDGNEATDVFVRDLQTGVTALVSQNWQGTASATSGSSILAAATEPVITPDGRYVAFQSAATNLVNPSLLPPGFLQSPYLEVYVRDLQSGTNYLASVSSAGQAGNGNSTGPRISADGRYVTFQSNATNLVANASLPLGSFIYRHDFLTGATVLLSQLASASDTPNVGAYDQSADGRVIGYVNNGQVWVWTQATGTAALVSTNAAGQPGSGQSDALLISADGQRLVFSSNARDLAPGVTNGGIQILVRDLDTGTIGIASASADAPAGSSSDCFYPALSADGQIVAFQAFDGGLVPGDRNRANDVFVRDLTNAAIELVSASLPTLIPVTSAAKSQLGENPISADGRYIAFTRVSSGSSPNDPHPGYDVLVRDTVLATNILASVIQRGGLETSQAFSMTPDGLFVAFQTKVTNYYTSGVPWYADALFVRDLVKGTTTLASVRNEVSPTVSLYPYWITPVISADGRYVAFGLDINTSGSDQYIMCIRDLLLGATIEVTSVKVDYLTRVFLFPLAFTSDRSLWYLSSPYWNLNRYHLQPGTNEVMMTVPGVGYSFNPQFSPLVFTPDGRFVAGQAITVHTNSVWRYDALNRTMQTLLVAGSNRSDSDMASRLSMSADGRFIAFESHLADLSPVDTNQLRDVYVLDVETPSNVQLVSINQSGTAAGNGPSDRPDISADGRFVTFRSYATDLTAGVASPGPNLYVRDLQTGITRLVSANPAGAAGDDVSFISWISADGTTIAFESNASDLVPNDYNRLPDAFLYHVPQTPVIRVRLLPLANGGRPSIVWTRETGKSYQVQYKNTLTDLVWNDLAGTPVAYGTNEWLLEDFTVDLSNKRYYRVLMLP